MYADNVRTWGRSTAKLGRHVTLGTLGEVGQCDSRNKDRKSSYGKDHALVPCGIMQEHLAIIQVAYLLRVAPIGGNAHP